MTASRESVVRFLVEHDDVATRAVARDRKLASERKPFTAPEDQSWRKRANCLGIDTALFYPGKGDSGAEAKAVCAACSVRTECGDYAMAVGEQFGVWAGEAEKGRRAIRTERAREAS